MAYWQKRCYLLNFITNKSSERKLGVFIYLYLLTKNSIILHRKNSFHKFRKTRWHLNDSIQKMLSKRISIISKLFALYFKNVIFSKIWKDARSQPILKAEKTIPDCFVTHYIECYWGSDLHRTRQFPQEIEDHWWQIL